jgi:zinc/manganese transport system substrate-binding protein
MINLILLSFLSMTSFAKLVIVTTTSDIQYLVKQIVADKAEVNSIVKGTQDPHFIEAKPSYMVKLQKADLLISNGLALETGWLPNLVLGSRNPKINSLKPGYLELGQFVKPIDSLPATATRAMGHVHPEGNPHFMLDPQITIDLGIKIAERVSELDPENKTFYQSQAQKFQQRMNSKYLAWKTRVQKTKVKSVITYHASMNYLLKSMDLTAPLFLEAKPGVPPSAQHLLRLIDLMKSENIKLILVDNFFDTKVAEKVTAQVPGATVKSVGISVQSEEKLTSLEDVFEQLVSAIEGK